MNKTMAQFPPLLRILTSKRLVGEFLVRIRSKDGKSTLIATKIQLNKIKTNSCLMILNYLNIFHLIVPVKHFFQA